MKIIHAVEHYYPSVGGMQEVARQLSERLAASGHDVTVVTSTHPERKDNLFNGVKIVSFSISGNQVNGITGETEKYSEFLSASRADVITFFAAQQWTFDAVAGKLDSIPSAKVFVPTGFSGLRNPAYLDYYTRMPGYLRKMNINVFTGKDYQDYRFAADNRIHNIQVISNGADENEFEKKADGSFRKELGIGKENFMVLHTGTFTTLKGHLEALEIFLDAKISNAFLVFIGNGIYQFKVRAWRKIRMQYILRYLRLYLSGKIRFLSLPRKKTVEAFKEADVFLFPSRIECSPLVLFEAAAAGLPFLSSNAGNAEEIASWTKGGLIIPCRITKEGYSVADIREGSALLQRLASDSKLKKELSEAGKSSWNTRFTWKKIAGEYEQLYKNLIRS